MAERDDAPDMPKDAPLRVRMWWRFWRGWRWVVIGLIALFFLALLGKPHYLDLWSAAYEQQGQWVLPVPKIGSGPGLPQQYEEGLFHCSGVYEVFRQPSPGSPDARSRPLIRVRTWGCLFYVWCWVDE